MMCGPGPLARVYRGPKPLPEPDRLETYLWNWSRWMKSGQLEAWYPGQSTGMTGGGASESFDSMCDREESKISRVVDTVIQDLPPVQSCALHHKYLNAVYRFRSEADLSHALALAKDAVRAGLKARHIL